MRQIDVDKSLESLGYRRVRTAVYRLQSSPSECENILEVRLQGAKELRITATFGFINREADKFALEALKRFGNPVFRDWESDLETPLEFSVGDLAGWSPGGALWRDGSSDAEFASRFQTSIADNVLPVAQRVNSIRALRELLLSDSGAFRWAVSNGALRAAVILYLGCREGKDVDEIVESLRTKFRWIADSLDSRGSSTPESFLRCAQTDLR